MFIHEADATRFALEEGAWARVSTKHGGARLKVMIREDMPRGLVRVPHGWWKPEEPQGFGKLSAAWDHADAQICPDDDEYLDLEQGAHLKGIPCKVERLAANCEPSAYGSRAQARLRNDVLLDD